MQKASHCCQCAAPSRPDLVGELQCTVLLVYKNQEKAELGVGCPSSITFLRHSRLWLCRLVYNYGWTLKAFWHVQGCAVAAAMCALQEDVLSSSGRLDWKALKFAILCSGYPSPLAEHEDVLHRIGCIRLPSLHISGSDQRDRQMNKKNACSLADWFTLENRLVLHHEGGHTIPSNRLLMDQCRKFFATISSHQDSVDWTH